MKKVTYLILVIIFIINLLIPNYLYADNNEIYNEIFKDITAPNLLLAEIDTGKILYERNSNKKIYPASLTKLMTAIVVLENCELDEIVTVSENAVFSVPSGYVNANLQVGEQLTVEDLLYVMLIPSANDAANALAEFVGGNIESFSAMMNAKARELGCTGSSFTNPSGLHQESHYTTTKDLYLIAKEAINNKIIEKIISTKIYTLPETNKYTDTKSKRIFATTNYMLKESLREYYCDYCIGGKTGFTTEAQNCVVEFAEKDGIKLIAIVMGENAKIKGLKFLDAKVMFEYVYKNYENEKIANTNEKHENIKIANATKETKSLDILYKDDVFILKEKGNNKEIQKEIEYTNIVAPIKKGDIVGKIKYNYDGIEYSTDLIASADVEEAKIFSKLIKILMILLIIYIVYIFRKCNKNHKKHGKNLKKNLRKK